MDGSFIMYVIWTLFFGLLTIGTIFIKNFNHWLGKYDEWSTVNEWHFIRCLGFGISCLECFSIKKVKIRKN